MATPEEIKNRVDEFDSARSSRRKAAAHRVSELAVRHDELASEVDEIKRTLAEVLAEYSDVITVEELARFTEVPASRLEQWRDGLKPGRGKRRRASSRTPAVRESTHHVAPASPAVGSIDPKPAAALRAADEQIVAEVS